jgi:multicomponent Na+:H+ antiporter subunit B
MNSNVLQLAEKYVRWLLLLFAIIALLRGHNLPGGGFIAGLLAGLSIVFQGFAYTPEYALAKLRFPPRVFLASGLSLMLLSMLPSILAGEALMQGMWISLLPWEGFKVGTPLLFDAGVFLAVIGVSMSFLFSLKKFV